MSILLEVCVVIVTVSIAAIAIATIRTMKRFEDAAEEMTKTAESVRSSIAQAEVMTRQIQGLATSIETVVTPLKRTSTKVEQIGDRVANLANLVVNQVEAPIRNTSALLTGVRTGARSLVQALVRRRKETIYNGAQFGG
jgi:uncharacterized protein YoxC